MSSPTRIELLYHLYETTMNISELTEALEIPLSSTAYHVNLLEECGLIQCSEMPGIRGSQKLCGLGFNDLYLDASPSQVPDHLELQRLSINLGSYFDCEVKAPCGLASAEAFIGYEDKVSSFYDARRTQTELLWFTTGFIEYRIPLDLNFDQKLERLRISVELCSEAVGYNEDWPSDIELLVNRQVACTIHSEGDYGDKRGTLNPTWWSKVRTQYGKLYVLEINRMGTFLNSKPTAAMTIEDYHLAGTYFSLHFQVREDARHPGGINLFGEAFGEHPQALVVELYTRRI